MVFVLVFVFLFCWSPYAVLSMAGILGFSSAIPVLITVLPLQMAKSSVLWNPIIYVIMNKQFQSAALKYLPAMGDEGNENDNEADSEESDTPRTPKFAKQSPRQNG